RGYHQGTPAGPDRSPQLTPGGTATWCRSCRPSPPGSRQPPPTRFQSVLATLFDGFSARRHQIGPDTEQWPKQPHQQKMEPSPNGEDGTRVSASWYSSTVSACSGLRDSRSPRATRTSSDGMVNG